MLPMTFDHRVLDGLPLPDKKGMQHIRRLLQALIVGRVVPFLKNRRGTDPIALGRVTEKIALRRLEDSENQVKVISLLAVNKDPQPVILIHERIYDFLVFVAPADPDIRLSDTPRDARKMLAFAEFMLRHQMEHLLYPDKSEAEVIASDINFFLDRRANDPTFYRLLREALSDEMIGIRGHRYLELVDRAEREEGLEDMIASIVDRFAKHAAEFPDALVTRTLPTMDHDLQLLVLGECCRRARNTAYPLIQRTAYLTRVVRLLMELIARDEKRARKVFDAFNEHWGIMNLFHELELSEQVISKHNPDENFELFRKGAEAFLKKTTKIIGAKPIAPPPLPPRDQERHEATKGGVKSLKDRIEEARHDAAVPAQVIAVIEKNKLHAVGHSGSKYSELIETLLAIPWGKVHPIRVSPAEFEAGLDRSHYGLKKPKEIISDFFSNLIWRYQQQEELKLGSHQRLGSAFLFVGPPGVGKTSLAISIARSLQIPYHKLSLGGMRDEADLRGHGFTYEGSKPGAIVQGLIKMGVMNGMFIMDEADKTEKFAVATLLEILDPEQNHLFHDKYTQTTIDIDLSCCHFILTANTLETVPPPVINRCEVVILDRYSLAEKEQIARRHLIGRVREVYRIDEDRIAFEPTQRSELLRYLIKNYTREAGVRELERTIRTLLLRLMRKEILSGRSQRVLITREKIKQTLEPPIPPRRINVQDRIGEMMGLGVNVERGTGSLIPIQATPIRLTSRKTGAHQGYLSMIHATGNIEKIMDESRKVATTAILHCARELKIDPAHFDIPIHLHFMGGSTRKDGPSAGGAIALALASALSGQLLRRDVAMTGEIDTQGRITAIGALDIKLETAYDAGCRTMIIPEENLYGNEGLERLSEGLRDELQIFNYDEWVRRQGEFDYHKHMLQIVAVERIGQAAQVAFIPDEEIERIRNALTGHAEQVVRYLGRSLPTPPATLTVYYLKDPSELDVEHLQATITDRQHCVALLAPEMRGSDPSQLAALKDVILTHDFDPTHDSLPGMLEQIASRHTGAGKPGRMALIAPYYFLKSLGLEPGPWKSAGTLPDLLILANNYTGYGFKIKRCKKLLNRCYWWLAQLNDEALGACPFLTSFDGARVADLSYIPERFRLDMERAQRWFNESLERWLHVVEEGCLKKGS